MSLVTFNFESQYLGNNHTVGIILPDKPRSQTPAEFYGNGKKYKVLWLLHGTFGDYSDWLRKSMIELYACENDLIVVMPSALNSNYANWPSFGTGFNMYDYIFEELMPLVYNWFPASDKREDNYIAGLSMGGTGASKYAINFPQYFAGAIILSHLKSSTARWLLMSQRAHGKSCSSPRIPAVGDRTSRNRHRLQRLWASLRSATRRRGFASCTSNPRESPTSCSRP